MYKISGCRSRINVLWMYGQEGTRDIYDVNDAMIIG